MYITCPKKKDNYPLFAKTQWRIQGEIQGSKGTPLLVKVLEMILFLKAVAASILCFTLEEKNMLIICQSVGN